MPKRFQGCTAKNRTRLMTCCLNAPGDGTACGPCPRCTYMIGGTRRCRNTTCMDTALCHAHYGKKYGVALKKSTHGMGLFATRDFAPGDLIAPMGGREVEGRAWEDRWTGGTGERNSPYGYTLTHPTSMRLKRRQGGGGYVRTADLAGRASWRNSRVRGEDRTNLRRAVATANRIYLVAQDDWEAFLDDFTRLARDIIKGPLPRARALVENMAGTEMEKTLGRGVDTRHFEAYLEVRGNREAVYDAACVRRVGSYANDPLVIRPSGARKANLEKLNARITPVAPFPLAEPGERAWLVALTPIKAKDEIMVLYGDEYWSKQDIVHGLSDVPVSRADFPDTVGVQNRPRAPIGEDGEPQFPRCTLRK